MIYTSFKYNKAQMFILNYILYKYNILFNDTLSMVAYSKQRWKRSKNLCRIFNL